MVIDTDGSAFITKAEFDSLKNNFQAQIDNYNSSIDSKIDGAIAGYLSGIKIASTRTVPLTCYRPDGIIAKLTGDELKWSEGDVDMFFHSKGGWIGASGGTSTDNYMAVYDITFPHATTPLNTFKENLLKYVDRSAKVGIWDSNAETRPHITTENRAMRVSTFGGKPWSGKPMYCNCAYFPPFTDTDLSQVALFKFNGVPNPTDTAYTTIPSIDDPTANVVEREIIKRNYDIICLTKGSLTADLGFNASDMRDWCNDYTNKYYTHTDTKTTPLGTIFPYWGSDSIPWTLTWRHAESYDAWQTENKVADITKGVQSTSYSVWQKKPYFGYVTQIDNWNKIYSDAYINDAREIERTTGVTLKEINGIKCVGIAQGIPLVGVNNNESIVLPIEFKDKTKNYVFWIKRGPFTVGIDPDSESNLVTSGKLNDVQKTDTNKYWSINGSLNNKIEIRNEGSETFYFVKWALSTDHAGGGVWMPPEGITIMKDN